MWVHVVAACVVQLSMYEARNKVEEATALYHIATKKFPTSKKVSCGGVRVAHTPTHTHTVEFLGRTIVRVLCSCDFVRVCACRVQFWCNWGQFLMKVGRIPEGRAILKRCVGAAL